MQLTRFARIKWERAKDLKKRGLYQEAEEELLEALEEEPGNLLLRASLAEVYLRQDRPVEARVLAEEILAEDATHPQALYVAGEVHFRQGSFDEALNCFEQAVQRDKRPYLALRVAKTLRELGRYDQALERLDSMLLKRKGDLWALKEKALVLNRMGRHPDALSLYEELRARGLKDDFILKEIVRLKGVLNQEKVTAGELEKVVNLPSGRKNAQLQGLLGSRLKEEGRFREAARAFEVAAGLDPGNLYFVKQQGYCLYHAGKYPEALECLTSACRKDPNDYYVKETLKKIYVATDNIRVFIDFLEELLHDHPQNYKLLGTLKGVKKLLRQEEESGSGTR